jgi:predicted nucleic acid-binding protein
MHCLDSSFIVDYSRRDTGALAKMTELHEVGGKLAVPSVALAEVLVGANHKGGETLARTLRFLEFVDVLPFDTETAAEAGRLGSEALYRGKPIVGADLLIAATARYHRATLLSRDKVFPGIPGLAVESY